MSLRVAANIVLAVSSEVSSVISLEVTLGWYKPRPAKEWWKWNKYLKTALEIYVHICLSMNSLIGSLTDFSRSFSIISVEISSIIPLEFVPGVPRRDYSESLKGVPSNISLRFPWKGLFSVSSEIHLLGCPL